MEKNKETLLPEDAKNGEKNRKIPDKRKKYFTMFLSVIIAIGLWTFVIENENPTIKMTYGDIPVEYLNEDALEEEGLVVADTEETVTVKVTLQGKRADLLDLDADDLAAAIDVSEYSKGDHYVSVEVHAPDNVKVVGVKPSQIKITVESLISAEKPVSVQFNGESPANKEPVFLGVDPENITVTGASSAVDSVKSLQAVVNTSSVTGKQKTVNVKLKPVDKLGKEVKGVTLSAEKADITVQMYSTKSVPLKVQTEGTVADGYSISVEAPESVQISCSDDLIDSVSEIETQPVDITDITRRTETSLIPVLPDGVRLASNQEKISAVIKVQKWPSKTIKVDVSDIIAENLPEGMSVEFEEKTVSFSVYSDGDLSDISAEEFRLSLDCGALDTEEFREIELTVEADGGTENPNIKTETPSVNAKLTAKE